MDEEDKQQHLESFESDVKWLRVNVPPDDIYDFAQQALMAADYFIGRLNEWIDVVEECDNDPVLDSWIRNIVGVRILKDNNINGMINTEFNEIDTE